MASNEENFQIYFHEMLNNGVYLAPSMYEAVFISASHTGDEIEKTLNAATLAFKAINKS